MAKEQNPNDPAPFSTLDAQKVKPDADNRTDAALSSQPQHSSYKQAKVGRDPNTVGLAYGGGEDEDRDAAAEVAETVPPAGPITIQERGVAKRDKPSANQDDAGATPDKE